MSGRACSFTAVENKMGLDVTACDIAYYYSGKDLKKKGLQDVGHAMANMEKAKSNYRWDYFEYVEGLRKHRLNALETVRKIWLSQMKGMFLCQSGM